MAEPGPSIVYNFFNNSDSDFVGFDPDKVPSDVEEQIYTLQHDDDPDSDGSDIEVSSVSSMD